MSFKITDSYKSDPVDIEVSLTTSKTDVYIQLQSQNDHNQGAVVAVLHPMQAVRVAEALLAYARRVKI